MQPRVALTLPVEGQQAPDANSLQLLYNTRVPLPFSVSMLP